VRGNNLRRFFREKISQREIFPKLISGKQSAVFSRIGKKRPQAVERMLLAITA